MMMKAKIELTDGQTIELLFNGLKELATWCSQNFNKYAGFTATTVKPSDIRQGKKSCI